MKMKRVKGRLLILLSTIMVFGTAMTAVAAGTISGVRITFDNAEYVAGEIQEPSVTASGVGGYELASVDWSRGLDQWTPGKKVTVHVTLTPKDGYMFGSSFGKSKCKVYGADLTSAKVEDEDLIVTASYTPVIKLGETEHAGWNDGTKTKATWKKVPYATAYQLRLYAGSEEVKTLTVDVNNVDLSQYMKKEANYSYEVRAIAETSADRKFLKDGEFVSSDDLVLDNLGDTSGSWKDYNEGNRYRDGDGNYVTNSWKLILGKWYYFNNDGYTVNGWQLLNNKWYYLDGKGVMQTDWIQLNNIWYFLNVNGDMATGWVQTQPGCWYYLNDSTGAMMTGWIQVNGLWYYLDASGKMLVNTTVDGYAIGADGVRL